MTTAPNTEPEKADRQVRILPISLFLLVPTMYVFGRSYWSAWLKQYGLTSQTFPLSADEAVYLAYEAVLQLGIAALPWVAKVGLMLGALVTFWVLSALLLVIWNASSNFLKKSLRWVVALVASFVTRNKKRLELPAKAYSFAALPFLLWGGALYAFFLLLIPILLGHYAGEWLGQRGYEDLRTKIASGKLAGDEQLMFLGETEKPLRLLICGELGCAGADTSGMHFIRWERIERIATARGTREKGWR